MEIRDQHLRAIDWLVCPKAEREAVGLPKTLKELLNDIGVSETSFYKWKKHPDFLEAWRARTDEVIGGPDLLQALAERIYRRAMDDSNSRANQDAALWYRMSRDSRTAITETSDPAEMSSDEIEAEIRSLTEKATEQRVAAGEAPSRARRALSAS